IHRVDGLKSANDQYVERQEGGVDKACGPCASCCKWWMWALGLILGLLFLLGLLFGLISLWQDLKNLKQRVDNLEVVSSAVGRLESSRSDINLGSSMPVSGTFTGLTRDEVWAYVRERMSAERGNIAGLKGEPGPKGDPGIQGEK
ncbi:collagen alpha-1(XVII) chain-like, partial [Pyxicephalus adspersus]